MSTELPEGYYTSLQDHVMVTAKEDLDKGERYMPRTMVFAPKYEIDTWLRLSSMNLETSAPLIDDDGVDPGAYACLYLVNDYGNAEALVHMLKYIPDDYVTATASIEMLQKVGQRLLKPGEDPNKKIVEIFKKQHKCHEKDIFAAFLRAVCKRTHALAYIKTDEIWTTSRPQSGPVPKGSLENEPDRSEAIYSHLETKDFQRVVFRRFIRKNMNTTEAPTSWEEPKIDLVRQGATDTGFSGRFVNLIMEQSEAMKERFRKQMESRG